MTDIHYENGNIHSPVIVLGDDPITEGNVLITRLGTAVSVPKITVTQEEGTPVDSQGNPVSTETATAVPLSQEAEIQRLKQALESATNALKDKVEGNNTEEGNAQEN